MTVAQALRAAATRLADASDTARLDAEVLMAHALGVSRSDMLLRHMQDAVPSAFAALVERRVAHEPLAYITGWQEFYGLLLSVNRHVLIPRADSETVIEAAREALASRPPKTILDIGTGSGALLLAALSIWPEANGCGIDRSVAALVVAMTNAQAHANTPLAIVGGPVPIPAAPTPTPRPDRGFARMAQRDWHQPRWAADLGQFDLILANPPYVEDDAPLDPCVRDFEPGGALFAGPEGLDDYRALVPQLPALLAPGGLVVLEIGHRQAAAVSLIAAAAGFVATVHRDLGGRDRALVLRQH